MERETLLGSSVVSGGSIGSASLVVSGASIGSTSSVVSGGPMEETKSSKGVTCLWLPLSSRKALPRGWLEYNTHTRTQTQTFHPPALFLSKSLFVECFLVRKLS